MNSPQPSDESTLRFPAAPGPRVRVGVDLVQLPRIEASLSRFGERFMRRLMRADEVAYALSAPVHTVQRVGARFAAKEAAIKALGLSKLGVDFRDIEVLRAEDGAVTLALHGRAAAAARALKVVDLSLSLSHDGDQAIATVMVLLAADT